MPAQQPETRSPADVAHELGVDEKTVRNWCRDGLIEATRLPTGRYRLSVSVLPALKQLAQEGRLNARALKEVRASTRS